jgi:hypothetical protein
VWAGCADPFLTQQRAGDSMNESENDAHDFWLEVVGSCDGSPAMVCTTAMTKEAQARLGIREQLTPRILKKFVGPFVDRPRRRRRIRYSADPARYVIEAVA